MLENNFLSVIIPVLNEAGNLKKILSQLQILRGAGSELIIVDGGSEDQSPIIAEPYADYILQTGRGRALQMNKGAGIASGKWLLFLHADSQISQIDLKSFIEQLSHTQKLWGYFSIRLSGRKFIFRIIESLMNIRSRFSSIATGDQGIFVRKSIFQQQGGYAAIPLMEDIRLSKALRRISLPLIIQSPIISSSRRWEENGTLKTILLMWSLRFLYWLNVSPKRLVKWYYK